MTDDLRTRIAAAIKAADKRVAGFISYEERADAVIAELGRRRCERCRKDWTLDQFPPPHDGSDVMRPFCIRCTDYIKWATS
jgi:hypothetical protein